MLFGGERRGDGYATREKRTAAAAQSLLDPSQHCKAESYPENEISEEVEDGSDEWEIFLFLRQYNFMGEQVRACEMAPNIAGSVLGSRDVPGALTL